VHVYPLAVTGELDEWPERAQRLRRWMSPEEASSLVQSRKLRRIIQRFARSSAAG